jgi:hypothetical protein
MMRTAVALSFTLFATACAVDMSTTEQDLDPSGGGGGGEPHDAKVVHVRGNAGKPGGGGSPNLVYHGGPVMAQGAVVKTIFWGASWSDAAFVADKISGLDSFYSGIGGTSYIGTNTEYTQSGGAHVGSSVSYQGHVIDTSAAARNGSRTSTILAEVCKMIGNPVTNGYYPVYIDNPRGHAGYCAWHSTGTCNGVQVQFAFFFDLDGDSGCDPNDTQTSHSDGLAALANVSGHELSEAVTDPHLDAWYDSSGAENSDKCAWTFGANALSFGSSSWKIQGNWSNAAYNANQGYGGNRGCIDGSN